MNRRGRPLFILTYLAPAALLYGVFVCWPLVQAFALSLYEWSGLSDKKTFVGLGNYQKLFADQVFRQSVLHNLWVLIFGGAVILCLGITLAHALQLKGRMASALRGLFLFPHVMSLIAVAILWKYVFDGTGGGLVNGIIGKRVDWLGQKSTALLAVAIAFVWYAVGFYVMLFMAGLRQIEQEVNEAAELDGAKGWKKFRMVTWPLLWSVKRISAIYISINVLNIFALVKVMTNGAPDRATEVILTYLYEQGIANSKFGYGSALAVVNFILVMAVSLIVLAVFRRNPMEARSR